METTVEKSSDKDSSLKSSKEEILEVKIRDAILNRMGRKDLEITDFKVEKGCDVGDNYTSAMYSVELYLRSTTSGETQTVPIMLKKFPESERLVRSIVNSGIFVKDISFYEIVGPAMIKFQEDAGLDESEIMNCWPKCLASNTDNKSDFLVMENLKAKGYKMADRKGGLDFDHCKLVMEALARFHAVSYAMFEGDFDKIVERYPWLQERSYKDEEDGKLGIVKMLKETFKQIIEKMLQRNSENGAEYVGKIVESKLAPELRSLTSENVKWAVIGHGDLWTNNVLFRYDEESEKPVEVKFVDFQITRAASRAVDIHYFLYPSAQLQVLNKREEELEHIYYSEFTRFVKKLGVELETNCLTEENFIWEINHFRYYGCVMGLMLAMFASTEKEDVVNYSKVTEESVASGGKDNPFTSMLRDTSFEKMKNIAEIHLPKCSQISGMTK